MFRNKVSAKQKLHGLADHTKERVKLFRPVSVPSHWTHYDLVGFKVILLKEQNDTDEATLKILRELLIDEVSVQMKIFFLFFYLKQLVVILVVLEFLSLA